MFSNVVGWFQRFTSCSKHLPGTCDSAREVMKEIFAQCRRCLGRFEVEVFLRWSQLGMNMRDEEVIRARGVYVTELIQNAHTQEV